MVVKEQVCSSKLRKQRRVKMIAGVVGEEKEKRMEEEREKSGVT